MPKCRRDQRGFAICLVVMVTVETLAIFTVMHSEHRAAEELAEERRAERRRARESEENSEELEDLSVEEQWAESLVRKKRALVQKGLGLNVHQEKESSETKEIVSLADAMHSELYGRKYGGNPKIRRVSMTKTEKLLEKPVDNNESNNGSWLAEPLPQANKRLFIKDVRKGKNDNTHRFPAKNNRRLVSSGERSRSEHRGSKSAGNRPRPQVVNLYRDITSL